MWSQRTLQWGWRVFLLIERNILLESFRHCSINVRLWFHFRWRRKPSLRQKERPLSQRGHFPSRVYSRTTQLRNSLKRCNSKLRWQAEPAIQLPETDRREMEKYLRYVYWPGVSRRRCPEFFWLQRWTDSNKRNPQPRQHQDRVGELRPSTLWISPGDFPLSEQICKAMRLAKGWVTISHKL